MAGLYRNKLCHYIKEYKLCHYTEEYKLCHYTEEYKLVTPLVIRKHIGITVEIKEGTKC